MKERARDRAKFCFIRGLQRYIGDTVNNAKPNSLEKALELALEREQYLTEQEALNPPRPPKNQAQYHAESNATAPDTLRCLTVNSVAGVKRRICYTCESTDHIRESCPHKPAKWFCTHHNKPGHSLSHCIAVHGKDTVLRLKEEEKKARIEREKKTSESQANPQTNKQPEATTESDLNATGAPKNGGPRSAILVIPPPRLL